MPKFHLFIYNKLLRLEFWWRVSVRKSTSYYSIWDKYTTLETTTGEKLERDNMFNDLLKSIHIAHILKQLNDFDGVLSDILLHVHLIEFLQAALDLSKFRNQSHLRLNKGVEAQQ